MRSMLRTRLGNQTRRIDGVINGLETLRPGEVVERWDDRQQTWRSMINVTQAVAAAILNGITVREVVDDTYNTHVLIIGDSMIVL